MKLVTFFSPGELSVTATNSCYHHLQLALPLVTPTFFFNSLPALVLLCQAVFVTQRPTSLDPEPPTMPGRWDRHICSFPHGTRPRTQQRASKPSAGNLRTHWAELNGSDATTIVATCTMFLLGMLHAMFGPRGCDPLPERVLVRQARLRFVLPLTPKAKKQAVHHVRIA